MAGNIIDKIIRLTAGQYRIRMIEDPEEAARLGVEIGHAIREPIPRLFVPEKI